MPNPYKIEGPAQIAFSGGRSSAFMLYHILDAHDGQLPNSVIVAFQNTGREMPETLDFVEACSRNWHINITWLEYDPSQPKLFKQVCRQTAATNGEPFEALIKKRGYLPNTVARFCTAELKIRTAKRYMLSEGFEHWTSVIGFRGDEPNRVTSAYKPTRERWTNVCPMAEANVTKSTVSAFWKKQPFDLGLPDAGGRTPLGNCDLCFMKSEANLAAIIRDYPERANWWVTMERSIETSQGKLARFHKTRTYSSLKDIVSRQGDWIFAKDTDFFCNSAHGGCTD